jgi:exonuclease VII large subunit
LQEGLKLEIDTSSFDQALEKAHKKVEKLRETLQQELEIKTKTADEKVDTTTKEIQKIEAARAARGTKDITYSRGMASYKGKTATQWNQSGESDKKIAAARQAIKLYEDEERRLKTLRTELTKAEKEAKKFREAYSNFGDSTDLIKTATDLGKSTSEIDKIRVALDSEE